MRTKVMVLLKPRAPTTVGKKLLNEHAERCMFCMKQSTYNFGSRMACANPARGPLLGAKPTVSSLIRLSAKIRSSSVSHLVVSGKSGRRKAAAIATAKVTMPSMMKSLHKS